MVTAIIQARTSSKRFPGKVFADLAGRTVLEHVVMRVKEMRLVDRVLLAVPIEEYQEFIWLNELEEISLFGGTGHNVLRRYYDAATSVQASTIVRITGDCPLLDPEVGDLVVKAALDHPLQFWSNDTNRSGFFDGTDVEAFSYALLHEAYHKAVEPAELEHVTLWMRKHALCGVVRPIPELHPHAPYDQHKLSIDTPEDLERVQKILHRLLFGTFPYGSMTSVEATAWACRCEGGTE